MKNSIVVMLVMAGTLMLSSCGNSKTQDTQSEKTETKTEYTSDYVCPMHCEGSGSDKEGTCPVCGMDYVALEDHKSDGHEHEDHSGHSH